MQIYSTNGRSLTSEAKSASNALVYTVNDYIPPNTYTTCGAYVRQAGSLSTLETLMEQAGMLDALTGEVCWVHSVRCAGCTHGCGVLGALSEVWLGCAW